MLTPCAWDEVFQDAIHEADPMEADAKILRAETVILKRIQFPSAGVDCAEQQALFNALRTIRLLKSARRIAK